MKRSTSAAWFLLVASTALAQGSIVTPKGLEGVACSGPAGVLGQYPSSRHMLMDGELRGAAATVKEVDFRVSYWDYTPSSTWPKWRSWTGVSLHLSECDIDQKTFEFARNPTTTPTLVFSQSVTWPYLVGLPVSRPAPWTLRFPFARSWIYSGKQDVCLDFDFSGGQFDGGTWLPGGRLNHDMESATGHTTSMGRNLRLGANAPNAGCADSAYSSSFPATTWFAATHVYSMQHAETPKRGKVEITVGTGAMLGPVITALGTAGTPVGTALPNVACNRLFVDLAAPVIFFATNHAASNQLRAIPPFDFQAAYSGVELWCQSAWGDSNHGALKVSYAGMSWIPEMPRSYRYWHLWQPDPAKKAGAGMTTSPTHPPITRYVQ